MNRLLLTAPLLALALPLFAQDLASADSEPASEQDTATAASELSALDRWQADRTEIIDASEITLSELLYVARPLVVFADSPNDPRFIEQMELIADRMEELVIRDVMVIVDTDPTARSDARSVLRPRGFRLVVMGKDGRVAQRKPEPWAVREIGRAIDKMPLRQQEIRERG